MGICRKSDESNFHSFGKVKEILNLLLGANKPRRFDIRCIH